MSEIETKPACETPEQSSSTTAAVVPTRRQFMKTSTATLTAGLIGTQLASAVYAQGSPKIKVGLVGCGGRGGGAAQQALHADDGAELTSRCAIFFPTPQRRGSPSLKQSDAATQITVTKDNLFSGWDGYKHLIDSVDVVLLATTTHFRPLNLKYAIAAKKHIFCEKPVGVDAKSVKEVMDLAKEAEKNKLNLVSGLCYRYDQYVRETVDQIHQGTIGDIVNINSNYLTTWLWNKPRQPQWSEMEYQVRNWLYYYWLSGDHVVEQHIHRLDKALWIMKDVPPTKVTATGGRQQRTAKEFGNIYDHFTNVFEWEMGEGRTVRCFSQCRQYNECATDVSDLVFGTEGTAYLDDHRITGKTMWKRKLKTPENMYDSEHKALFGAIRSGKVINNGDYMCKSTLMGIMARESAYSGKAITWDQIINSTQDLSPKEGFKFGPVETAPVAVPVEYKFV